MKRREFLKMSGTGLAAVVVGGAGGWSLLKPAAAVASTVAFDLTMVEAAAEMVDGVVVDMWAYKTSALAEGVALGARIPGPTIFAIEGDTVRITVRNDIGKGGPHSFAIPGVVDSGPLEAGEEKVVEFAAPRAGTYLYLDALNAPVNRVMGLHGVLVSLPDPVGNRTPYSDPTPNVRRLFDDLGTTAHFPGHFWDPDRNAIWVFCCVDPFRNEEAAGSNGPIDPARFSRATGYLPQYFQINGKSGFFAAQHGASAGGHAFHGRSIDAQAEISIHGHVGQPCLIRTMNAGLFWHSPHIHGNHVYRLTDDGVVRNHLELVDTWTLGPLMRKDVLLPMFRPPDIPAGKWPPVDELFPLLFPMHDHQEISNTAAGANYPQGAVTHFQFDGDIQGGDEVILVDRAELRVRTGQIELSGRSSGATRRPAEQCRIDVHATSESGRALGSAVPTADLLGTWTWRGRAQEALATREITLHNHVTGAQRTVRLKLR